MIATQSTSKKKKDLLTLRDCKMVEEFYQLYEIKRLRLDDVLLTLSSERFFLQPSYIYKRIFTIEANRNYYDQLVRGNKRN